MIKRIAFIAVLLSLFTMLPAQEKDLVPGMLINKSTRIRKTMYRITAGTAGAIVIEGNNIVIDFNNCELKGNGNQKRPDLFTGTAILVRNSNRVTIKNLKANGYKIALLARNVDSLTLENCDFSYNYRQHLNSTQEKEDISDWMSYHQNENDEWLRYGAAVYLRACNNPVVKNCRVTGGQNALMLMECKEGLIYNNDFSFNSGIGIGLYRSSHNRFLYNKLNFNVRGYSHGVYSRGQDSAGFLVYEQSSENTFFSNSATHSGDGFFLWAGQTTMNTGEGGCNDNLVIKNDFSYAPTNGIEVTFSRNYIAYNRIFECDHGIWGGYSFSSRISDNQFRNNRIGIAIEHGLNNRIDYNIFYGDKEAVRLWSKVQQPADWGYARYRDTRSANYTIYSNSFNKNPLVLNISRTDSLRIYGNTYTDCEELLKTDSAVGHLDSSAFTMEIDELAYSGIKDPLDPFKGGGALAGRKNILVTEWGPYDFRSPIIWNINPADKSDSLQFDLLGPKGKWVIKRWKGLTNLSAAQGEFPARLQALRTKGKKTDIEIELEYRGGPVTGPRGEKIPAGKPYRFFFRKFFQPIDWEVRWYAMDTVRYNPIKEKELFDPAVRMVPFKTEHTDRLDYAWWGGIKAEEQHIQFITMAEGEAEIAKGLYELSVTWDDAVRVYVDNKLVLDEWNPAKYKFDESPNRKIRLNLGGNHQFRVEHLELGGFASLGLKLLRVN